MQSGQSQLCPQRGPGLWEIVPATQAVRALREGTRAHGERGAREGLSGRVCEHPAGLGFLNHRSNGSWLRRQQRRGPWRGLVGPVGGGGRHTENTPWTSWATSPSAGEAMLDARDWAWSQTSKAELMSVLQFATCFTEFSEGRRNPFLFLSSGRCPSPPRRFDLLSSGTGAGGALGFPVGNSSHALGRCGIYSAVMTNVAN